MCNLYSNSNKFPVVNKENDKGYSCKISICRNIKKAMWKTHIQTDITLHFFFLFKETLLFLLSIGAKIIIETVPITEAI